MINKSTHQLRSIKATSIVGVALIILGMILFGSKFSVDARSPVTSWAKNIGCFVQSMSTGIIGKAHAAIFTPGTDEYGKPAPWLRGLFMPACGESDIGDDGDLDDDADIPPPPPGTNGIAKFCSGIYRVGDRVRMRVSYSYSLAQAGTSRIEDNLNSNLDFDRMIAGPAPSGAGPGGGDALVWTFFGTSGNGTLEFDVIVLPSASGFIPNAAILRNAQGNFASSCLITVSGPPAITGDIYASLALQNLAISGPAVVSSGTGTPLYTRVGDGPIYPVSRYVPALTATWRRILNDNITRLRLERAQSSPTLPRDFDGNPDRLGGGIWYRSSGMTIPDTSIDGRGTYIVDNGDIMITGNILSQRPVGIVARNGNIRITSSVTQLRNIYFYAPNGTIIFDDANTVLNAIGAFIAQRFQLSQRDLNITYNTQVALTPPPGFVSFILPTVLEGAP